MLPPTPPLFDLSQRDLWIIGGAGYLGRSVVTLLASMEARVFCADLEDRAHRMVADAGLPPNVTPATLDANDTAAVERFVAEQCAARGVPHGLAVMTYSSTGKRLDDLTPEDFDRANRGNLTGTFVLARAVLQRMAARGSGSVVLFSSMYGTVSPDPGAYEAPMNPNPIEYGVGKAGIQQMNRYFAVHFGPRAVRCNAISPARSPPSQPSRRTPSSFSASRKKSPSAASASPPKSRASSPSSSAMPPATSTARTSPSMAAGPRGDERRQPRSTL